MRPGVSFRYMSSSLGVQPNQATLITQNTGGTVPAITVLIDQLNQTVQFDRPRLTDLLTFTCSSGRDNCTGGEEHAALLAQNLTYLIKSGSHKG